LDTVADALASIEYYLEALREQRPNRDRILDIARQSLEALGYWPVPVPMADGDSPVSLADRDGAAAALGMDLAGAPEEAEAPAAAMETGPEASAPVAATPEPASMPAESAAVSSAPPSGAAEPTPSAAPEEPTGGHPPVGGFEHSADIDDDIREVFLEELDEEVANLGELLQGWQDAPHDTEQVRSIRRIFHTLKGSGRLVGARALGEFSWKIENMLNRVLDGSRDASPAVVALVAQAHDVLPQFRAALAGTDPVTADLAAMEAVADRVAAGEEVRYEAPVVQAPVEDEPVAAPPAGEALEPGSAPAAAAQEAPGAAPEEEGVPASVDAVLLEILAAEAASHLSTIRGWLDRSATVPQPADDALQRAIHTLNGALAMTEVPVITEITSPAEAYVRRLLASGQPATAEGVGAMEAVS